MLFKREMKTYFITSFISFDVRNYQVRSLIGLARSVLLCRHLTNLPRSQDWPYRCPSSCCWLMEGNWPQKVLWPASNSFQNDTLKSGRFSTSSGLDGRTFHEPFLWGRWGHYLAFIGFKLYSIIFSSNS